MINKKETFDNIRNEFGKLSQSQVNGFDATFDYWNKIGYTDNRWLAYILATDWHEGNKTMQPIKEFGGNAYFVKLYWTNQKKAKELGNLSAQDAIDFCGKGKPQITGRANYSKLGKALGYPLEHNPDLMFDLKIATEVMFYGMTKGLFTGKRLDQYFNNKTDDPLNARRIINGTDKAELIKDYHIKFLKSIV